jgi:hypothetical protein
MDQALILISQIGSIAIRGAAVASRIELMLTPGAVPRSMRRAGPGSITAGSVTIGFHPPRRGERLRALRHDLRYAPRGVNHRNDDPARASNEIH